MKDLVFLWMMLLLSSASLCSNYKATCQKAWYKRIKTKVWMQVWSSWSSEHLAHEVLLKLKETGSWFLFFYVGFDSIVECTAKMESTSSKTLKALQCNWKVNPHMVTETDISFSIFSTFWTPHINVCHFNHLPQ